MSETSKRIEVNPPAGIPGGEILLSCTDSSFDGGRGWRCRIGDQPAHLVGASTRRVLAIIPEGLASGATGIELSAGDITASTNNGFTAGGRIAEDLHPVANPAYSPIDGAVYVTRSGSRGQQLPVSLFRLDSEGDIDGVTGDIPNPTGLAFDRDGQLYVSSRLNGTIYRLNAMREAIPFARDLGVATGIAFDWEGNLFVGDRTGTIYKVDEQGDAFPWTTHEPSVSAYHLAFGPDKSLYVTGPTVSSYDAITRFDSNGNPKIFFRGLGRPQGLAFDLAGNLYVAGSYRGRRGIIRIAPDGSSAEMVVAGMNIVGLCFGPQGDMVVATNDALYSVPIGIYGTLVS
jgi:sugar lactone lactonase YvrE